MSDRPAIHCWRCDRKFSEVAGDTVADAGRRAWRATSEAEAEAQPGAHYRHICRRCKAVNMLSASPPDAAAGWLPAAPASAAEPPDGG